MVVALLDGKGELFDLHRNVTDALHDAVGPRFRPRFILELRARGAKPRRKTFEYAAAVDEQIKAAKKWAEKFQHSAGAALKRHQEKT